MTSLLNCQQCSQNQISQIKLSCQCVLCDECLKKAHIKTQIDLQVNKQNSNFDVKINEINCPLCNQTTTLNLQSYIYVNNLLKKETIAETQFTMQDVSLSFQIQSSQQDLAIQESQIIDQISIQGYNPAYQLNNQEQQVQPYQNQFGYNNQANYFQGVNIEPIFIPNQQNYTGQIVVQGNQAREMNQEQNQHQLQYINEINQLKNQPYFPQDLWFINFNDVQEVKKILMDKVQQQKQNLSQNQQAELDYNAKNDATKREYQQKCNQVYQSIKTSSDQINQLDLEVKELDKVQSELNMKIWKVQQQLQEKGSGQVSHIQQN